MGSLIWFEARGEPLEAQRGVLDVAINRARVKSQTICEVLKAPGQFQWTKHHDPTVVDSRKLALLESVKSKRKILTAEKFFYSLRHAPMWAHNMTCRVIGKTTFCKEKR